MRLSQFALQRTLSKSLKIRVAANVLLVDKDIWHRALVRHLLEGILHRRAVI